MAELLNLNVQARTERGKGPNRRLRAEGMVPGIYYNAEGANIPVKVELIPLQKAHAALGSAKVFHLVLEKDGKTEAMPALMWRIRKEPIKGLPEHVDFFGVDLNKEIKVAVPFHLIGSSKGVKLGGTLELFRDTIEVICKPMDIPEAIKIDVTEMDILDSKHIEDVEFPEGVTPLIDENYAIVAVHPKAEDEDVETEAGAAAAEPEVVGAAKEEDSEE